MNKLIYDSCSHGQKVIFSTAEELTAQAQAMQESISIFKIDLASQNQVRVAKLQQGTCTDTLFSGFGFCYQLQKLKYDFEKMIHSFCYQYI